MAEIKQLSEELIQKANNNSFGGKRGDLSKSGYTDYAEKILGWNISEEKKQKLLDKLYLKWSEILKCESQHVSVMVAGPANYNSQKLDHGERILRLSSEFSEWFKGLEEQIEQGQQKYNETDFLIQMIEYCKQRGNDCDPTGYLAKLSALDQQAFIKYYEELYPKYKWRKNSNIVKLHKLAIEGKLKLITKDVFFEDDNLTAYTEGERAYIKFRLRPERQLIAALKSRGYWWNSRKNAWSTYLEKLDKEWVKSISVRYVRYL